MKYKEMENKPCMLNLKGFGNVPAGTGSWKNGFLTIWYTLPMKSDIYSKYLSKENVICVEPSCGQYTSVMIISEKDRI